MKGIAVNKYELLDCLIDAVSLMRSEDRIEYLRDIRSWANFACDKNEITHRQWEHLFSRIDNLEQLS